MSAPLSAPPVPTWQEGARGRLIRRQLPYVLNGARGGLSSGKVTVRGSLAALVSQGCLVSTRYRHLMQQRVPGQSGRLSYNRAAVDKAA